MGSTRVISIVSGKGGVGKTTLSINLAYVLANNFEKNVLLIDANITTSHLGLSLGITSPRYTLNKILKTKNLFFEPENYKNVSLILSAISPHQLKGVNIKRIKELIRKIERSKLYDFVLLDSAPGLGREAISVLEASKEIIFITNPLTPAAIDIIRVSEMAGNLGIHSIGLVLNMVRNKPFELSAFEIERFTNIPVIASIPFDRKILTSLALKKPVVEIFPNAKVSKEIVNLGGVITGESPRVEKGESMIEKIKKLFSIRIF